jgi:hypothetical protein
MHCVELFALLAVLAGLACSPQSNGAETAVDEHGTLIPWNTSLVALDEAGTRLAAVVVGLSNVELLTVSATDATTSVISPPSVANCSPRQPIAVAAGTLVQDDRLDVLVQDPCQAWAASGSDGTALELAALVTFPVYADVRILRIAQHSMLAAAAGGLHPLDLTTGAVQQRSLATPDGARVTHATIFRRRNDGGGELVVQRLGGLSLFSLDAEGTLSDEVPLQQQVAKPYLLPFDMFDSLAFVASPECPEGAVGIGAFVNARVPRKLQLLELNVQQGTFATTEVESPDEWDDILSVAVFPRLSPANTNYLGVIARKQQQHVFQLAELSGCNTWSPLLEADIDFALRSPEAPAWRGHPARVPITNHVTLMPHVGESASSVTFAHYDGYDLRRFRADLLDTWQLTPTKLSLHDERQDLAIVE